MSNHHAKGFHSLPRFGKALPLCLKQVMSRCITTTMRQCLFPFAEACDAALMGTVSPVASRHAWHLNFGASLGRFALAIRPANIFIICIAWLQSMHATQSVATHNIWQNFMGRLQGLLARPRPCLCVHWSCRSDSQLHSE